MIKATLQAGMSTSENRVVGIPLFSPMADVVFAFGLASTMTTVIDTAKSKAAELMAQLDALGIDINYGVISYMDYPHCYDDYCGYSACYGSAGDYPYRVDRAVTADREAVANTINGLALGNGGDSPQCYTRVFYESYADPNVSWRASAKRILVNFADSVPHDCNLNEGVPGREGYPPWSTGGDPGRDEKQDTPDDLDLQQVLAAMAGNRITLIEAHASSGALEYWGYWTGITGGHAFQLNTADFVNQVVGAIKAALTQLTIDNLHLEASFGFEPWLTSVPSSYSGLTGVDAPFGITITVPSGTAPGDYLFSITAVDSSQMIYYWESAFITVFVPVPGRSRGIKWLECQ
jgi:hypothetical protein